VSQSASMSTPVDRFAAWITESGLTRSEAAKRLGCHPSYPGLILRGQRRPGRDVALAIERVTRRSSGGVIRVEEWAHTPTMPAAPTAGE
jgi:transcriptional regulator with XRE-family HTH domain